MYHYLLILLIFFLIDILIYRFMKINFFIDCMKISLPIFFFIQYLLFYYNKVNIDTQILIIVNYIFFLFFYYFVFIGIKKVSPTLFIIHLLKTKKNLLTRTKSLFLEKKFFYSRIKENTDINLIFKKKSKIVLTKKGMSLINIIKIFKNFLKV